MAGHRTKVEKMPWAATRAGHRNNGFHPVTGSVRFISPSIVTHFTAQQTLTFQAE